MHTVACLAVSHKASRLSSFFHPLFCCCCYVSLIEWFWTPHVLVLAESLFGSVVASFCRFSTHVTMSLSSWISALSLFMFSISWLNLLFWLSVVSLFLISRLSTLLKFVEDDYFEWGVKKLAEFHFFRVSFWCLSFVVPSCFSAFSWFWWSVSEPDHYKGWVPLLVFKD